MVQQQQVLKTKFECKVLSAESQEKAEREEQNHQSW